MIYIFSITIDKLMTNEMDELANHFTFFSNLIAKLNTATLISFSALIFVRCFIFNTVSHRYELNLIKNGINVPTYIG